MKHGGSVAKAQEEAIGIELCLGFSTVLSLVVLKDARQTKSCNSRCEKEGEDRSNDLVWIAKCIKFGRRDHSAPVGFERAAEDG